MEKSRKVPADILAEQRDRIAGTEALIADVFKHDEDLHTARRAYAWWLATEIARTLKSRNGFSVGAVSGKFNHIGEMVKVEFLGREYTDSTGVRRVHRIAITVGFEDHRSEGECCDPDCEGELETRVLENGKLAIVCNECGEPWRPTEADPDIRQLPDDPEVGP